MSCADVQTIQAGNGSKTQFSFDFPYLFKTEIEVSFWNATTKEWDVKATTDATYPWQVTDANPTIVEFTSTAPPSPATPVDPGEPTVDNVRIRRNTSIDDIQALFSPGSAIRSDDLNKNFEQLRYAIQESNCEGVSDEVYQYLLDYYWDRFDNTLYSADTWRSDDATIATTAALDQRFQDEVNDTLTKAELAALSDVMPDDDVAVPTTGATKDYIDHVIETDILVDGTGLNKSGSGGQVTIGISAGSVDLDRIKAEDIITSAESNPNNDTTIATTAKIDDMIDEAITNDIGTDGTGITVTDDGDGTITLGLADNSIDFSKIKDDDIITYAEQNAGSPAWNSDDRLATTWAASKRFDTIVQTATPTGSDWQIGKTWLQNDSNKTLSIWNGSTWLGIASGGTFTTQPSVIYVDSLNGDDANDGHRIITPKATIKNAVADANDGDIIIVAPGVYQETLPIDITVNNLSIVGSSQRSCFIIPAVGDEEEIMFRCNSGTYIDGFTFTGLKASGTRGNNALDDDPTYGLPENQGWVAGFYPGCTILKSPYINNCTSYMDSAVDVTDFDPNNPAGTGGDTTSAMTGGGILVDGSVPATASPLRSFVVNEFTQVNLDGPGLLVTNNGYAQAVSFFALFCHYHAKALNGGQINMEVGTTDFGRYGLIADGKSSSTIFTATADGAASTGATSFLINAPSASAGWFGSATRPANTMLVEVGGNIYPILSSSANGSGWSVVVSNPDTNNRNVNNGLVNGHSNGAAVNFYLRSQISAAAHTFEYAGSGVNYSALPQNGGVADESNQVVQTGAAAIAGNQTEGAVFYSSTDENGKFKVGDTFQVDQKTGFVTIDPQSYSTNLVSDLTPQLGGDMDVQTFEITTSTTNGDIVLNPNGTGKVNCNGKLRLSGGEDNQLEWVLPSQTWRANVASANGNLYFYDVTNTKFPLAIAPNSTASISVDTSHIAFRTDSAEKMRLDSSGRLGVGTSSPGEKLHISGGEIRITSSNAGISNATTRVHCYESGGSTAGYFGFSGGGGIIYHETGNTQPIRFFQGGSEAVRIDGSGRLGIGVTNPSFPLHVDGASVQALFRGTGDTNGGIRIRPNGTAVYSQIFFDNAAATSSAGITCYAGANLYIDSSNNGDIFHRTNGTGAHIWTVNSGASEAARIDSSGRLLVGTSTAADSSYKMQIGGHADETVRTNTLALYGYQTNQASGSIINQIIFGPSPYSGAGGAKISQIKGSNNQSDSLCFFTGSTSLSERMRIDNGGRVGIGTTSPGTFGALLEVNGMGLFTADGGGDLIRFTNSSSTANLTGYLADVNQDKIQLFAYDSSYSLSFGTNNTERARIDSEGRLLVGTTSSTGGAARLQVKGSTSDNVIYSIQCFNSSSTNLFAVRNDGLFLTGTATSSPYNNTTASAANVHVDVNGILYRSTSSLKYKENVEDAEHGLTELLQLRPVTYTGKSDSDGSTVFGGLIAEEVDAVGLSEFVQYAKDGSPDALAYGNMVSLCIKAIQEQQAMITELQAKIETLEQRLSDAGIA